MGPRVTRTQQHKRLGASRTQVLGLVAGAMVVVLVVAQLGPAVAVPASTPTGSTAAAVDSSPPAPAGAPLEIGAAALRTRYEPIAKAGPFRVRSFRPAPPPRPDRPPERRVEEPQRERYYKPPDPKVLELRLTGFMGEGEARVAILEEGMGQGRGILAKKGDAIATAQVAEVMTDSLVIVLGGERSTVSFADPTVKLPLEAAQRVAAFMPESQLNMAGGIAGNGSLTTTGSTGSSGGGVVLQDDEKKAVLERLKARRAAANAAATGAPPPAPPAPETPGAPTPPPTTTTTPPAGGSP